jgi:hypothetical protein
MTKKIIFNGCSFMAGDEVAWEHYRKEIGNGLTWKQFCSVDTVLTDADREYWNNYHHVYRKNHNLPQFVINSLGLSADNKIDISSDGKSNDMISISTINYILGIPPEERKNYHVVIGWTSIYRVIKYSSKYTTFMSLNVSHIHKPVTGSVEFSEYINAVIINAEYEDVAMNYFKNVLMLENFLLANNITYTFYKAIGNAKECTMREHKFDPAHIVGPLKLDKISNVDNWIKFFNTDTNPIAGESWTSLCIDGQPNNWVHANNSHPNMTTALALADVIKNKILEQQVLN